MSEAMNNSMMNTAAANANRSFREQAIAAFQEHLVRMFHMPAKLALARVNAELAHNPLTCHMQLQAQNSDATPATPANAATQTLKTRLVRPQRRRGRRRCGIRRRRAFTLVELLVVIGIIAVLISILLPTLGRARRAGQEVACMSNLRQLATAMHTYADAYKGNTMPIVFTPGDYWHHLLAIQLGDKQYPSDPNNESRLMARLMRCPTLDSNPIANGFGTASQRWSYGDGSGSYGINLWLLPKGAYAAQFPPTKSFAKLSSVRQSSEVPIVADSIWVGSWPDNNDLVLPQIKTGWGQHQNGYFMGRFCIDRHRRAINTAFVDGHVSRMELQDLWKLRWHRQSAPKDVKVP
jgi:prepilin-type N-terminal cleavage/methylation domain-containing protein/prepilin-type processing-associated H-X9-DG protein